MSHHLVIGPLVLLCELDHFIQRQHTVAHLANRGRERGRDKKRVRERQEKGEGEGREGGGREGEGFVHWTTSLTPTHSCTYTLLQGDKLMHNCVPAVFFQGL